MREMGRTFKQSLLIGIVVLIFLGLIVIRGLASSDAPKPLVTITPTAFSFLPLISKEFPLPDLTTGAVQIAFNPGTCGWDGGTISASVKNIGAADAGAFEMTIQQQVTTVDQLPAGLSTERTVQYPGVLGGFFVVVDSSEVITESDETNNSISATFTPPPTCTPPHSVQSTPTATPTDHGPGSSTPTPTPTATPQP